MKPSKELIQKDSVNEALQMLETDATPLNDQPAVLKIDWPIEATGRMPYRLYVIESGMAHEVPAGTKVICLAAKTAYRRLVPREDGAGKVYLYSEEKTEGDQDAAAMLLLLQFPEGNKSGIDWAIAEMRVGGVQKDYFSKLAYCTLAKKNALVLKLADHSVNLVASRQDPTKKYLSPNKFSQVELENLSEKDLNEVSEFLLARKEMITSWRAEPLPGMQAE